MSEIDADWAIRELTDFVFMTELVETPPTPGFTFFGDSRVTRSADQQIIDAAQVVEQILVRVVPRWRAAIAPDLRHRWAVHREAAQRAIVQLRRAEEVRQHLGDDAPTLDAGALHSWVWVGARSMWRTGHFRQAVYDAGKRLNAETQNKYGTRDLSEGDLFTQAFSDNDATSVRPRLRLPGDDGGKTSRSMRRGVRDFASGCYAALRNPQGHDVQDELPEHEALEQLAALSVLARWVDRATVLTA